MQVVDGRILGPLWHFLLHFHVSDERGKVVAYRNLSDLRQRLAPVMLRRDKRVVKDQLPDRTVQVVPVPLSARQAELHAGALMAAAQYSRIMKRRPLTPSEEKQLLANLQTARMACDAAGLVDKETVGSPKLEELARILEAVCIDGGDKVVVFSQGEVMTRMAEVVARELGLGVARLHGGVPTRARGELVDRFKAAVSPWAALAQAALGRTQTVKDVDDDHGPLVEQVVAATELAFAGRIEQMIVRRAGLVAIVDRVDDGMLENAARLSSTFPVAVMDRRTWQVLQRMGHALTVPAAPSQPAAVEPALVTLAKRRLAAAEVLIEQAMGTPALELLAGAMLARAAAVAGRDIAPEGVGAAAWLFGEALPKGFVPVEVAHAIVRAQSLGQPRLGRPRRPVRRLVSARHCAHAVGRQRRPLVEPRLRVSSGRYSTTR